MLFFPTQDEDFQYFRSQGYTGSINDMHYKAMGDLGYTGSLNDRIHKYLTEKYGSFYEAMRDLRNGTSIFSLISAYAVNNFDPSLVFDFEQNYYRTGGTKTTLNPAVTHTRAGQATMTDGYGAELVTNGDFATNSDWTLGDGWTISGGVAVGTNTFRELVSNTTTIISGRTYIVTFEITSYTAGRVKAKVGGTLGTYRDSVGVYTEIIVATNTDNARIVRSDLNFTGSIDNISVKEMPVIKWAPHNLMTYSEDFSNGAWTKGNTTVVSDVTSAPNGEDTADLVYPTTSGSYRSLRGLAGSVQAGTITVSVWLKYAGFRYINALSDTSSASTDFKIDLVDGVLTNVQSGVTASIVDSSNGWYKVTWEETDTARFYLYFTDTGGTSCTANGTDGVYAWGAHLYRSDLGGMVNNLETGDSYVRTAGKPIGPELVANGTFDTNISGWTVLTGTNTYDNGTINIQPSNYTGVYQEIGITNGLTYTVSVKITAVTSGSARLYIGNSISNKGYYENATELGVGIHSRTFTANGSNLFIGLATTQQTGADVNFDNISVKEIDVNPATARYLPRVGHHIYNGDAWVNEGVLHESEARTNLLTYSQDFSNAAYGKTNCSVTSNATIAPDGTTTADKLLIPTTDNSFHFINQGITMGSVAHTVSVFFKAGEITSASIFHTQSGNNGGSFNLSTGVATASGTGNTASMVDVGNGWYHCSVTNDGSASVSGIRLGIGNGALTSFVGVIGQGIFAWGAQLEAGSTPSSYIPTSGSTVTRAAETLTVPAANLPYDSTNMSIQMDGRMTYADLNEAAGAGSAIAGPVQFYNWGAGTNNYVSARLATNSGTGQVRFQQEESSIVDTVISGGSAYAPDINVPFNLASRHGSTFINGAVDGTALTANTTPTALPDLSTTDLNLGYNFMGTIGKFRVWSDDLTDTGIATASAPSTEPSLQLTFDGLSTSSFTVLDWSE